MAGLIADAYGLPAALLSISAFPLLAAVVMILLFRPDSGSITEPRS
jgi:hypothetical protein